MYLPLMKVFVTVIVLSIVLFFISSCKKAGAPDYGSWKLNNTTYRAIRSNWFSSSKIEFADAPFDPGRQYYGNDIAVGFASPPDSGGTYTIVSDTTQRLKDHEAFVQCFTPNDRYGSTGTEA